MKKSAMESIRFPMADFFVYHDPYYIRFHDKHVM